MARRLHRFFGLPRQRQFYLVQAAAALAIVWAGMRILSYSRTRAALLRLAPSPAPNAASFTRDDTIPELAWAVSAVAHHAPVGSTCLQRTLALWWLLRLRGIESDVRIGTAQTERGIHAHAWLERDGVVLNDEADVGGRFAAFDEIR